VLGSYHRLTRRIRPDTHELIWADTRGRVYPDANGKAAFMRGIIIDVTERVRSEQALTEANRRKDEFLAMLAHELRNPLAPIANASALIVRSPENASAVRTMSEVIARQVRHMSNLVDDLLDVSRVTRGLIQLERVDVDLKAVVHSALEQSRPLMESKDHTVSTHLTAEEVWVSGDRTRLVQVLVNLLNNAAKFTPAGGMIAVSLVTAGGRAKLSVQDNGAGIGPELLAHVFDLFTQGERTPDRAQGGLGIGLALVKALVGLHGGEVKAQSEGKGHGSQFTLTLPQVRYAPEALDKPPDESAASAPLRILVTDDNVDAAHSLASLLELDGHAVHVCYDGSHALAWAARHLPQVCILDVGLPDMTGLELCRRLKEMHGMGNALYIALTGYGQPQDRAASAKAGFHHHLVKPVEASALSGLLARCVAEGQVPTAAAAS
jgi:signal transduction histidine kinase/ActR/RegA family two-component response regulator